MKRKLKILKWQQYCHQVKINILKLLKNLNYIKGELVWKI